MVVTVYFWLISKQWFYIILVGYLLSLASAGLVWFLPESPVYLMSRDRVAQAVNVFRQIAKVNKKSESLSIEAA